MHLSQTCLKATKSFTHGAILFDVAARTVRFGKLPQVAVPECVDLEEGATLLLRLVGPDGKLRNQTRSGILKANDRQPGILRIAGTAKTSSKFNAENGWRICTCKFRAYFSHPGMLLTEKIPEWVKESANRQRLFWNQLALLCREARRKCSPVAGEEVISFVRDTILPAIDAFNHQVGRFDQQLKHPAKLKVEMPGLDGIWSFVGELRRRIENGRPVPLGLLEKMVGFAQPHKADFTPLNEFLRTLDVIADREAEALGLREFEKRSTFNAFKATLRRRKSSHVAWSEGWPRIKCLDRSEATDWVIEYRCNKAGLESSLLESGMGIPGLSFGLPLPPALTNHPNLKGVAASRALREAHISISGDRKERWTFDFAVLQHYPLPARSHIKGWKLLYRGGELWLCLTLEVQRPLPNPGHLAAGLDIGWRRTETGIRFGTLYEPAQKTIKEMTIDLQKSPLDPKHRVAFQFDFGPNRWDKRNIARLFPDWKPGDPFPGAFEGRFRLSARRFEVLNQAKDHLRDCCGERLPMWINRTGWGGMIKLREELKDDLKTLDILNYWLTQNQQLTELSRMYSRRAAARLEYGHLQVAHDVCRYLQERGISRLVIERNFLASMSRNRKDDCHRSLRKAQKYRHFIAPAQFVDLLRDTAEKYAIAVEEYQAANTTRICHHCNYLNAGTLKEQFPCGKCGTVLHQDQNAAINLSRFAMDPSLASLARTAKSI